MKKIAIALILSLASTSAFAQAVGDDVTNLAPAGTTGVAGTSVVIAGVGTATWVVIGGFLLLVLVAAAGSDTTTN
jgi:uncharacterized protein YdeI (BOF family)